MSELLDEVVSGQPAGLPVLPWEFVQRIDALEAACVRPEQLRAAMVLVESLVTRVDALEARVTALEKRMDGFCELNLTLLGRVTVLEARPSVKSRAEYMRKYRAKSSASAPSSVLPASVPPVSDTPPA